ncbi:amidase family protein [Actinophytocola sp.]|uniref:amidase family protein n=1 Tax=Actinophytocola sp. TaxID=1872138 RepID=UPI0025C3A482|nr:amidase family protein [Actinophytocola sp.]
MPGELRSALRRAGESSAFIALTGERALREAAASAARRQPLGPLDGMPVAWKDLFDVEGTRSTNGSATRRDAPVAVADAPVVANLAAAGAVCLGKTNLSELAFSGLGLNPHFGNPVNPLAPDRVPGGSSSGSAVAVADGIVDLAVGTDTSGSVRVPAAFCGLVGFRSSVARHDRTGMLALSPSFDCVGVFARDMAHVVAADAALRGVPARPVAAEPFRAVVPAGELVEDCAPEIAATFRSALSTLEKSGVDVERRPLPALIEAQGLMDRHGVLAVAEAVRRYGHLLDRPDGIDPLVLRRLSRYDPAGEPVLRAALGPLRRRLAGELAGAVLLCPTVRDPAPPVAPLLADLDRMESVNRRVLRTTMLLSYLGLPGVALPHGALPHAGLRGSVLLSVPDGGDDRLLAVAAAVAPLLG